jgi:hypothetical protein
MSASNPHGLKVRCRVACLGSHTLSVQPPNVTLNPVHRISGQSSAGRRDGRRQCYTWPAEASLGPAAA